MNEFRDITSFALLRNIQTSFLYAVLFRLVTERKNAFHAKQQKAVFREFSFKICNFSWRKSLSLWQDLSGEGVREKRGKSFENQALSDFQRFYRAFRFCSPVPEREGGEGEGFDCAKPANDCYAHTAHSMRKVFLGKQMFAFPAPSRRWRATLPRIAGEGFGRLNFAKIQRYFTRKCGVSPKEGKIANKAPKA